MTDRTKRIRDAKAEAQKEIEEYRNQKEEEYKKFEAEVRHRSPEDQKRYFWNAVPPVRTGSLTSLSSTRADLRRPKTMRTWKPRRS